MTPREREEKPRPVQDEWGLFDPDQAGLRAVVRRIREAAERGTPPTRRSKNS